MLLDARWHSAIHCTTPIDVHWLPFISMQYENQWAAIGNLVAWHNALLKGLPKSNAIYTVCKLVFFVLLCNVYCITMIGDKVIRISEVHSAVVWLIRCTSNIEKIHFLQTWTESSGWSWGEKNWIQSYGNIFSFYRVFGFYKGILPPILAETPKRAVKVRQRTCMFVHWKLQSFSGYDATLRIWFHCELLCCHMKTLKPQSL